MSNVPTVLSDFFKTYAVATATGNVSTIAAAYTSTYIEAGPREVRAFRVDAKYRKQLKQKSYQLRHELGLQDASAKVVSATEFAPGHHLVDVEWTMTFVRDDTRSSAFRISYLVRALDDKPEILAYVSHEDEVEVMKRDGII